MTLEIGDSLPSLSLPASGGATVALKDFKGGKLVVYFYPKDNTPGCTVEGQDFSAMYKDFKKAGAEVVGISKDSVKAHDNFCAKFDFAHRLLSDVEGKACDAFGTMVQKSMYGKTYLGIDRSTFLFDAKGHLRQVWRKVKVKGHAAEVLEAVKSL